MRHFIFLIGSILCLFSCKTRNSTPPSGPDSTVALQAALPTDYPTGGSEKLYASRWLFTEVAGKPVTNANAVDTAHLLFYPGQVNRVSGSTGCNRLNGTFSLTTDNGIKFSPIATTKRLCPGDNQPEQSILSSLQNATHFYVVADTLLLLNNQRVVARLLTKKNSVGQNQQLPPTDEQMRNLNEELLRGVDFKANGNEPFWSLDIDRKQGMRFRLASGDSIVAPAVKPVRLQDVAASSYRAQTGKGLLTVVVYDKACVNSMSGDKMPKTVHVTWNNKTYEGCGTYLADYRLDDTWVLRSINDSIVDGKKFNRGAPQLELKLAEQRVSGHSGCNGFGAHVEITGRFITFSRLTGTMMACDDNGFETRYYRLLSEKEMPYEIMNGFLTIRSGSQTLRYQKIY